MFKILYINKILIFIITVSIFSLISCKEKNNMNESKSEKLSEMFTNYWSERMQLLPLESTAIGDTFYNDKMPILISKSYRDTLKKFYQKYLNLSKSMNETLGDEDKISKELFEYEMNLNIESFNFESELMPINQFWSFTIDFAQLGSGTGNQPFKTPKDYSNFLERMKVFPAYIDVAIENMKIGMQKGYTIPKILALKVVPQLNQMLNADISKNIFYKPIVNIPTQFSKEEKEKYTNAYKYEIVNSIIPSYNRLKIFFEKEYIPACRNTDGIAALPNGKAFYQYLIKQYTTTNLTPDSIYHLGLLEVGRIKKEMEDVKTEVGFSGTLQDFFVFMNADKQFYPFKTPQNVLDSFSAILNIIQPNLNTLFETAPKTKFEIRQTEAYRAASASAEYNAGSEDGTRPGIFYVPILDAKKFNAIGMETLFLHEAIPGHHYQISLQQENTSLPKFRKFLGYSAYAEGWALYSETLGKQLSLYKNPYQYFGHLSDAMHRAIRLVVDVAIHTKEMSHDEAIQYMMNNERISKEEATAEIERYMALPGQALSYKIGQLTIISLKNKYEKQLGEKFKITDFHTQILNGGNMPLQILEKKLELWVKSL